MVPAGGGRVNMAPNVSEAIPFALTPRQANVAVPIDYTSTTGVKIFNSTILNLSEIFDGEPKFVNLFNEKLVEMANQSVWM